VGDSFAFPLRKAPAESDHEWELIAEECDGLLVPCVKEAPPPAHSDTGVSFLQSELAGAFANGGDEDMWRAADYLRYSDKGSVDIDAVEGLVAGKVGDDQERWLSIAVVCYCDAAGMDPSPKLAELLTTDEQPCPLFCFAARALSRLSKGHFDDRFITEAFKHAPLRPDNVASALSLNYPRHPTVLELLKQALQASRPEGVTIALSIIKDKDDPLVPAAVRAARELLLRAEKSLGLCEAWQLIDSYGNESDLPPVLDKIRTWQESDRERYTRLWESSGCSARLRIPVIRIVIEDRRVSAGDARFCDEAVLGLQIATRHDATGHPFGLSVPLPKSTRDRDAAVERAKRWLRAHPE
jgi:hypothetical protein